MGGRRKKRACASQLIAQETKESACGRCCKSVFADVVPSGARGGWSVKVDVDVDDSSIAITSHCVASPKLSGSLREAHFPFLRDARVRSALARSIPGLARVIGLRGVRPPSLRSLRLPPRTASRRSRGGRVSRGGDGQHGQHGPHGTCSFLRERGRVDRKKRAGRDLRRDPGRQAGLLLR